MYDRWQALYCYLILPLLMVAVRLFAIMHHKTARTLQGHRGLWHRIEQQAKQFNLNQPLIWFHVASAGELLQAQPVMERFMGRGYACALTLTSVSGMAWANKLKKKHSNLVLVDYLPFDTLKNTDRLLKQLNPVATIYVKFDLWPNLIWQCHQQAIPQFLISATLRKHSKRLTNPLGRSLCRSLYACLNSIFAVSKADQQRFLRTNPDHPAILQVGDTRFDSVLDRKKNISPPSLPESLKNRTTMVLGSTWPTDEIHIFPAIQKALTDDPQRLVFIAPHETKPEHLLEIENYFSQQKMVRFSQLDGNTNINMVLIDSVGQLSALYHYANIAFVGGAFGKGVHNVMEPAAMGVPAICGPYYQNSPEVIELVEQKKCFSITNQEGFQQILFGLLSDLTHTHELGQQAASYIEQQAGASDICFRLIEDQLHEQHPSSTSDAQSL